MRSNYAHQRGLVHLDIKPSNVLLAGDGQPMLLDFHLACEIDHLRSKTFDRLGGTVAYMSPEQRAAAEALRRGDRITQQLDGRSDIYSLGVLLYESLADRLPDADAAVSRRALCAVNPHVSRGLEDILHKCLSLKPAARYPDAGQLAADLRFQLSNLPLRGVPNRSPLERWQKWRRRKPYAMPLLAIGLAAIVVVCGVCGLFYRDRVRMASSLLVESQREFDNKEYDSSIEHAQTALSGLHWFSWQTELKEQLNAKITAAKRAQAVVALHDFVDRLRFLDNQPLSDPELKTLADQCDTVWEQHNQLAPATAKKTDERQLANADDSLRNDLLDLAILSARLDIQLSPPSKRIEAQRKARQKLNDAAELCGGSAILDLERRTDVPDAPANAASSAERRSTESSHRLGALRHWPLADAPRFVCRGRATICGGHRSTTERILAEFPANALFV